MYFRPSAFYWIRLKVLGATYKVCDWLLCLDLDTAPPSVGGWGATL